MGDPAAPDRAKLESHGLDYLLIIDAESRPLGWAHRDRLRSVDEITADLAVPSSPLLDRRTTLKDALSLLLEAQVQMGLVTDRSGALLGVVTVDRIAEFARQQNISPGSSDNVDDADVG